MTRATAVACIIVVSGWASTSGAAVPCVAVTAAGGVLDASARARIVEQMGAALAPHHMETCGGDASAAIAEVAVERSLRPGVAIKIRVRDAITQKEIAREVDLRNIPADGRALAVALAADELLRASWAELALAPPPTPPPPTVDPPRTPPPEVREEVVTSMAHALPAMDPAPSPLRPTMMALMAAAEHATGGLDRVGADVRLGYWLRPRLALTARVGARGSPRVHATHGDTDATAWLAGVGALVAVTPADHAAGLEALVRVDAERVQFVAHPNPGARGADASGLAVIVAAGVSGFVRIGDAWSIVAEGAVGYAVEPVNATDGGAAFTGISGANLAIALGLRGAL